MEKAKNVLKPSRHYFISSKIFKLPVILNNVVDDNGINYYYIAREHKLYLFKNNIDA